MWNWVRRVERVAQNSGLEPTDRLPRAYPDGTVSATYVGVAQPPQRHKAIQMICICYLQTVGCQEACFCTLQLFICNAAVEFSIFHLLPWNNFRNMIWLQISVSPLFKLLFITFAKKVNKNMIHQKFLANSNRKNCFINVLIIIILYFTIMPDTLSVICKYPVNTNLQEFHSCEQQIMNPKFVKHWQWSKYLLVVQTKMKNLDRHQPLLQNDPF